MTWSGWESLGDAPISDLCVTSSGPNRFDVFGQGNDNALWHKRFDNGSGVWESLGGHLTSAPAAVSSGADRIDVFVRGDDNGLWHKGHDNGWGGWEPLGGHLTSAPAAVSSGPDHIEVFARGDDNGLWHKRFDDGSGGWEPLGGQLTSAPAAVSSGPDHVEVFVRGDDNGLWHKRFDDGSGGWEPLGGAATSDPGASSSAPNRLDVFVRGEDDNKGLWHKRFDNGWGGWESLGGELNSRPAAVSSGPGRTDVFVIGVNNGLWRSWSTDGDDTAAILSQSTLTAAQIAAWWRSKHHTDDTPIGISAAALASLYIDKGNLEGVRGDIAFAQAIVETGHFTNSDSKHFNFAGIAHPDDAVSGIGFASAEAGVIAQIQLLKEVATGSNHGPFATGPKIAPNWGGTRRTTWKTLGNQGGGDTGYWASALNYWEVISGVYRSMGG